MLTHGLICSRPTVAVAYASLLRPFVTLSIMAKWCVLEQKLLLTAYSNLVS